MSKLYVSPFSERYGSEEMSYLFSPYYKALLFRKLWIALAEAQRKLGLPIEASQISAMKKKAAQINFKTIARYEEKFHHDIMAHIHAFGDLCPEARPILHLGATSSFVTDNAELIQMREALALLVKKLKSVLRNLSAFAKKYASAPCLGYTHFQAAQPTTIGKRASLWLYDFFLDAKTLQTLCKEMPFLGVKGTTGTQASFFTLLKHKSKVHQLELLLAESFQFSHVIPVAGQTYTRKIDVQVLNSLSSFAASSHKFGTDLRLLSHEGELSEGFGKTQVGSSAMPYKKNPIYAERVCGIARFVMNLAQNGLHTAATQWLERSLDDSSNRRLSLPEAFLGADALLELLLSITSSLQARPEIALSHLQEKLASISMENILMASVEKGGDRQHLHEKLRKISLTPNLSFQALLEKVEKDKAFGLSKKELLELSKIPNLIGLAPEQTHSFLSEHIGPFLSNRLSKKN